MATNYSHTGFALLCAQGKGTRHWDVGSKVLGMRSKQLALCSGPMQYGNPLLPPAPSTDHLYAHLQRLKTVFQIIAGLCTNSLHEVKAFCPPPQGAIQQWTPTFSFTKSRFRLLRRPIHTSSQRLSAWTFAAICYFSFPRRNYDIHHCRYELLLSAVCFPPPSTFCVD